jgi:hypothetical protein
METDRISGRAGNWRLQDIEKKPGGFIVERSFDSGRTWGTIATFPVRPCGNP